MTKKIKNDQGHIIEAIKEKNRHYVWSQVKFIGTQLISSIDERFLVFNKAFDSFDPYINNNFIYFYRNNLRYRKIKNDDSSFFSLTSNRNIVNTLKSEASTPTSHDQELVNELKKFMNIGG